MWQSVLFRTSVLLLANLLLSIGWYTGYLTLTAGETLGIPVAFALAFALTQTPRMGTAAIVFSVLPWAGVVAHQQSQTNSTWLAVAGGVTLLVTLHAVFFACLIRKVCEHPLRAVSLHQIVRLILLLAGVCIGPVALVLMFDRAERLPGDLLATCLVVACCMYVIVPSGLAILHPNREIWSPRILRLAVPLLMVGAAAIWLQNLGGREDNRRTQEELDRVFAAVTRHLTREGEYIWRTLENERLSTAPMRLTTGSLVTKTHSRFVKFQKLIPAARECFAFDENDVPSNFADTVRRIREASPARPIFVFPEPNGHLLIFMRSTFADAKKGYCGCYLDWADLTRIPEHDTPGLRVKLVGSTTNNDEAPRLSGEVLFAKQSLRVQLSADRVFDVAQPKRYRLLAGTVSLGFIVLSLCWLLSISGYPSQVRDRVSRETEEIRSELVQQREEYRSALESTQQSKRKSLETLSGGVSHEINTILTHILGESEKARRSLPTYSPAQKYLNRIGSLVNTASEVCEQLADSTGAGTRIEEQIDLISTVRRAVEVHSPRLPNAPRVEVSCPAYVVGILASSQRIERILKNLLTNAAEAYTSPGGRILVSVEADPGENHVVLRVQDFGCGMRETDVSRVFEPFYTTKKHGRGLGLAAVQGIAVRYLGHVVVESQYGLGTTVIVTLGNRFDPYDAATPCPSNARTPEILTQSSSRKIPLAPGTAIVVDDDSTIRAYVGGILESQGWLVYGVENGKQAVSLYRQHAESISLIVLDLLMPVMDGRETLRELRLAGCQAATIVMSAYSDLDLTEELQLNAGLQLLQKPFRPDDLNNCLQRMANMPTRDQVPHAP